MTIVMTLPRFPCYHERNMSMIHECERDRGYGSVFKQGYERAVFSQIKFKTNIKKWLFTRTGHLAN